jgi:hypothetical protein
MKVFITGDAYFSPAYPILAAMELLRATAVKGQGVIAVNYQGAVPMILQSIAQQVGLELTLVEPAEGEQLDEFHRATLDAFDVSEVVMIHDDALVSTVYQSLVRVVPEDKLRLASMSDLMV